MNKTSKYMIMVLLSGATYAACSDTNIVIDEINNNTAAAQRMTFTAAQENNGTRATVNGNKIEWQSTDHLSVFDGTSNCNFSIDAIDTDNATSATFTGEAAAATTYTALYPYQSAAALSAGDITGVTLPANQTATADSFDPAAALMMAVTTDSEKNFAFKNAVSYLKITIEEAAKSISITSTGGEFIAGTVTLNYNSGAPTATVTDNGSSSVTLAPASGTLAAGTYYLAVLPQTLASGFSLSYNTEDLIVTRKYDSSYTIERNKVIDMGTLNKTTATEVAALLTWSTDRAWTEYSKKIVITNVEIEVNQTKPSGATEQTSAIWSYVDEDGATLHIQTSGSKIKLLSANELFNFFNALTSISGLGNLDLSEAVSTYRMFKSCYALTSLDLSGFNTQNVTNMEEMFYYCKGLTSLNVSSLNTQNVTNMHHMFAECNNLTTLDVSNFNTNKVTNMKSMFYSCQKLTSLTLGSNFKTQNVTNMGSMFGNCNSLTELDLKNFDTQNVTDMSYMFHCCYNLSSLTLNENFKLSSSNNSMFNMVGNSLSAETTCMIYNAPQEIQDLISTNASSWGISGKITFGTK